MINALSMIAAVIMFLGLICFAAWLIKVTGESIGSSVTPKRGRYTGRTIARGDGTYLREMENMDDPTETIYTE